MINPIVNEGFKLSPQQRHLWSLQKDSLAYQAQCTIRIIGDLNRLCLELALQNVIKKHEILRTKFHHQHGFKRPLQFVSDDCNAAWCNIDLSYLNLREQEAKIESILLEQRQRDSDVIVRACLLTIAAQNYILLLSIPAMNGDTKTLNNLISEISQAYAACLHGEDLSNAKDEVIQYLQFSEWQNQLLEDKDELAGKKYWDNQDFSALATLLAPYENQANIEKYEFVPKPLKYAIVPEIGNKIFELSQKDGASIEAILLTCWQVLIWRLTGQKELIIGTAFDGRQYEELANSLGLFVKYLPVNSQIESQDKFVDVLERVQNSVIAAAEWQDYFNYAETLGEFVYPIGFEFTELPTKYFIENVSFAADQYYVSLEKVKIKLNCYQQQEQLFINFCYDNKCYAAEQVKYLAEQFSALLESIIQYPQLAVSRLNILSEIQQQKVLVEFNQTTNSNFRQDLCIHQLFAAEAAKIPDNIAVVFEDEQVSYRELNNHANQLANYLQQLGVKPDVLVGIFLEKSHLSIVSMLGILKAGGAYLPLDPNIPEERLDLMLQDAQVQVLLTQEKLLSRLPASTAQVVCLDNWEADQNSFENPLSSVTRENLAYVIYTSGSTGTPKGVAVEHRQLCNYLHGILEKLDLPDTASFATVSTFAADLGNTVIFSALCTGGCLHIISPERATNPVALAEYCRRHPIDCLKIVPSHLNALLTTANPEEILPSQLLILGGEAASWDLVTQVQQLKPSCQILNHYGPTEATIGVLTYKVEHKAAPSKAVPLGRPLANTQIYLLDEHLQPVPIYVPGELYIGGANLARGYLNRPELTQERFIPNPFTEVEGSRLYKTGDLARYLPDGNIEFLGRCDRQVKIHGFRIELEEVEAILRQHPDVRQAVATVREERLVAYVVSQPTSTSDLRQFMQERLPEYMVPTAFVILNTIPLTANGKVDYQALPAPELAAELEKTYIAPRTPQEEQLAKIWAEILGLKQVGIGDNFFELGGDSILSIQVISKANQAGLQLTPKQLFEHQTIAELAAVAQTTESIKTETGLVTGKVPLTPIQHWFFAQNLPNPHHWNQSVLLEVRQHLDFQIVEQVIKQLLQHHDALRLRFQQTENGWQQINAAPDEIVSVTRLDLSGQSAAEQEKAITSIATELQASLNLSTGPLMRVAYFDLGQDKLPRLLIIIHHLVVDGVSWRILLDDLQTAYQQLSQGEEIQLPAKTTAFKQWADKLSEYAQSPELQSELEYWQNQTQKSAVYLPTDDRDANTVASARTVSISLSSAETQALLQEVPKAYQTQVNDILLTALVQACAQWTGDNSLLLTLEAHGREDILPHVNLSRTVGWFTAQFPVLLNLGDTLSPGDALKTIKEQLRNIPRNGISYSVLKYLSQNSSLQATPQPQLKFNYLGQFDQVLSDTSIFKLAAQTTGPNRSLQGSRSHLIEIDGMVTSGQLQLTWTYSQNIHHPTTIERLAESFIQELRRLIAHCQSQEAGGYTPSDFPEAELSQPELDKLLAKISQMSR